MKFNKAGQFKIVQFTDLHFKSGMFATMKEMGDVMETFVGNENDNDYSVMWHNMLFSHGGFIGGNTEYNRLPNEVRVIVLNEGTRTFTSCIRQKKRVVY